MDGFGPSQELQTFPVPTSCSECLIIPSRSESCVHGCNVSALNSLSDVSVKLCVVVFESQMTMQQNKVLARACFAPVMSVMLARDSVAICMT